MKKSIACPFKMLLAILACCLMLFALSGAAVAQSFSAPDSASPGVEKDSRGGRVYVMTNAAEGNMIAVFHRDSNGALTRIQDVFTGGLGSGPGPLPVEFGGPGDGPLPLNSQDSLVATKDGRFLLAVNAGSDELSVLAVTRDGLKLVDKAPSGGIYPISVAQHKNLVYVLNLGAPKSFQPSPFSPSPNVTGFSLDFDGHLHMIPDSTTVTGSPLSVPDDLVLSPDGKFLIVAELMTDSFGVYPVGGDGRVGERINVPT